MPAGAYEHLPDDWATRSLNAQIGIIEWIDANLLHQDSVYGHTMRAVGLRQWDRRRKEQAAIEAEEEAEEPPVVEQFDDEQLRAGSAAVAETID